MNVFWGLLILMYASYNEAAYCGYYHKYRENPDLWLMQTDLMCPENCAANCGILEVSLWDEWHDNSVQLDLSDTLQCEVCLGLTDKLCMYCLLLTDEIPISVIPYMGVPCVYNDTSGLLELDKDKHHS